MRIQLLILFSAISCFYCSVGNSEEFSTGQDVLAKDVFTPESGRPCAQEIQRYCPNYPFSPYDGDKSLELLGCLSEHIGSFSPGNPYVSLSCNAFRRSKAAQRELIFPKACKHEIDGGRCSPTLIRSSYQCLSLHLKDLDEDCRSAFLNFIAMDMTSDWRRLGFLESRSPEWESLIRRLSIK